MVGACDNYFDFIGNSLGMTFIFTLDDYNSNVTFSVCDATEAERINQASRARRRSSASMDSVRIPAEADDLLGLTA